MIKRIVLLDFRQLFQWGRVQIVGFSVSERAPETWVCTLELPATFAQSAASRSIVLGQDWLRSPRHYAPGHSIQRQLRHKWLDTTQAISAAANCSRKTLPASPGFSPHRTPVRVNSVPRLFSGSAGILTDTDPFPKRRSPIDLDGVPNRFFGWGPLTRYCPRPPRHHLA
jgi:hypothetical protein